jgi:hypothetical protein
MKLEVNELTIHGQDEERAQTLPLPELGGSPDAKAQRKKDTLRYMPECCQNERARSTTWQTSPAFWQTQFGLVEKTPRNMLRCTLFT